MLLSFTFAKFLSDIFRDLKIESDLDCKLSNTLIKGSRGIKLENLVKHL